MKKIRLHNDIHVSWGITTNGKQESLEAKTLQVQLVVYNKVITIPDFSINGNVISFEFSGSQQKYCGVYTLVCRDTTNGNLSTIDKTEAFELVPHSEEEQGTDNPNVALEVVTLNTDRDSSTIGRAATIEIGEVKTLRSGAAAYVRNSGTTNAAILDFGIPSGSNGNDGMSGYGISAEPASVTFNTDSNGNISSSQDKLIRMKAYLGGQEIDDVTIVGLSTTNFANTVSAESDGKSFYLRGSDLQTVHTTDLDGNSIKVPVTQAQVAVDCKIGGSDLVYSTIVRVFVNTQTFYTTLVSNQKMFKQTFTELSNSLDEQGVKLEKYYSEFQQTARGLSATISSNKQDADGSIENITNKLEATSSSLSSTIEANKKDADGNFEKLKTEFKQTTDGISSTVEKNKTDAEGSIEKLKTEFKQTTDGITSTVEQNKTDADGKLESLSSKISQNAKNIEIANSRFNEDGSLKNKSGLMTTADKATLASREYVDGKVVNEATITTMINNEISTATIKADQIQFSGHQVKFDAGEIVINSKNFNLDGYGNVTMSGEIHATSGQIGGFELEANNLVCSNARLTIGGSIGGLTRMVTLDAKSFDYERYNFALSVVNYDSLDQSSTTLAGIHINVGASGASTLQYPGIVMENGVFVGFRVPFVPLAYSMDFRYNASIYVSGMYVRCNNSSDITITLPTPATGAKMGDVFTVIKAGSGNVTIKAVGVNYHTANGKSGEFTSTRLHEQIHLVFDGDTWFSESSGGS